MSDDIFEGTGTDVDNAAKRVPVALCLDTSGSMSGNIAELNSAVKMFYEQCKSDSRAKNSVEVIAIQFGGAVTVASAFSEVEYAQIPNFTAGGGTPMGEAVHKALESLEQRKDWYKGEGISYYQPILVLMSDGGAGDSIVEAARKAKDLVDQKKLHVLPLAFGDGVNEETLRRLAGGESPIHIKQGFDFMEFFKWLSASATAMAAGKSVDFTIFTN